MKENKTNKTSLTSLLKKLENIEKEVREVREEIAQISAPAVNGSVETSELKLEYTLKDLYEAFGPSKRSYAVRLNTSLSKIGVNTLGEFLALTPGQLMELDGVGVGTLQHTKKALDKLGVRW